MSGYSEEKKKIRFIAFNLFVFFISVYLLTASAINFYHTDASQLRIEVVRAIVERFDVNVSEDIGMQGYDGRYYSWVGIGSALLAIPFYLAGKFAGSPENAMSIVNQIVSAATATLVFLFVLSLGYSKRASVLTSIFFGIGTLAWPMAKHPFDHPVETFFILLSVYSMYRYLTTAGVSYLLISAFSFGFAFITRQTSVLVMLPIFIMAAAYYIKRHKLKDALRFLAKDTVLFALAFLPFIILIFWYNYYRFGSIFETGHFLSAKITGINYFTKTPLITGLIGFIVSPGKGYFYYSPMAILFFFSIKSFMKKHSAVASCFILTIVFFLLFYSQNMFWHGDWAWGPRYIFALTPFLIIPIAEFFDSEKIKKWSIKAAVYFILGVSIIIQIAGISVDFNKYFIHLQTDENVEFLAIRAEGLQPVNVPTPDHYFKIDKSHIVTQFKFIHDITRNIKNYRYSPAPEDAPLIEKIKAQLIMNVFDFWWVYKYFQYGSYGGIVVAICLFTLAVYSLFRLKKYAL
jgi:4-amino-4-deoxy-L-arabinose transferase-like glycosyltransferase